VNSQWLWPLPRTWGWEVAGRYDAIKGAAFHIDHLAGQAAMLNDPIPDWRGIDSPQHLRGQRAGAQAPIVIWHRGGVETKAGARCRTDLVGRH